MANDWTPLLQQLDAQPSDPVTQEAKALLLRNDTVLLSDRHIFPTVGEALHLWSARHKISTDKGHTIYGATELIVALEGLTKQKKLKQINLCGAISDATLFFEKVSGKFVGGIFAPAQQSAKLSRAS